MIFSSRNGACASSWSQCQSSHGTSLTMSSDRCPCQHCAQGQPDSRRVCVGVGGGGKHDCQPSTLQDQSLRCGGKRPVRAPPTPASSPAPSSPTDPASPVQKPTAHLKCQHKNTRADEHGGWGACRANFKGRTCKDICDGGQNQSGMIKSDSELQEVVEGGIRVGGD